MIIDRYDGSDEKAQQAGSGNSYYSYSNSSSRSPWDAGGAGRQFHITQGD